MADVDMGMSMETSVELWSASDNATTPPSPASDLVPAAHNASMNTHNTSMNTHNASMNTQNASTDSHAGCLQVVFSQMEFVPWDNPDNLVSAEVEVLCRQVKDTLVVVLFALGGPGNVLSMAVFCRQGLGERVHLCLFALALADALYLAMGLLHFGEQAVVQLSRGDRFGPVLTFLANHHFTGLMGFGYVSNVLSAIIAIERCHCVLRPLTYPSLMRTRTMAGIIGAVYMVVLGLYFLVSVRYRIGCLHDPVSGAVMETAVSGRFYAAHRAFIDLLHGLLFGMGLPWGLMVVTTATTAVTTVKLRETVTWRARSSSSSSPGLSSRERGLTRMLVASSAFFLACLLPVCLLHLSWLLSPQVRAGRRRHNFFMASLWLTQAVTFVNSSFNFALYYCMGSRFRRTLWALLGARGRQDKG